METEIDVIVFESGDRRFAIELRYVQEVCTLGYVTQVPLSPNTIQGATSVRGRMVPVVTIHPLFGEPSTSAVLPGSRDSSQARRTISGRASQGLTSTASKPTAACGGKTSP